MPRSFAIVIQQLPLELRDAVCVFYLVLRALDTVEDDMALPAATKLPLLKAFHERIYDRRGACGCSSSLVSRPRSICDRLAAPVQQAHQRVQALQAALKRLVAGRSLSSAGMDHTWTSCVSTPS